MTDERVLIPIVAVIGVFTFVIVKTVMKARIREAQIRERIAMIERGLMPPPEVDPVGFDRAMTRLDRYVDRGSGRHRRAGITLIGVGLGLIVLIGFTSGEGDVAIGVGGFFVVMGFAFFLNSLFEPRDRLDGPRVPPLPARPDPVAPDASRQAE
jgi:hypothetical protein